MRSDSIQKWILGPCVYLCHLVMQGPREIHENPPPVGPWSFFSGRAMILSQGFPISTRLPDLRLHVLRPLSSISTSLCRSFAKLNFWNFEIVAISDDGRHAPKCSGQDQLCSSRERIVTLDAVQRRIPSIAFATCSDRMVSQYSVLPNSDHWVLHELLEAGLLTTVTPNCCNMYST